APERDASRLLVLRRTRGAPPRIGVDGAKLGADGAIGWKDRAPGGATPGTDADARTEMETVHATFRDLDRHISPGDLLVFNDTRVLPARLIGRKESGGRIELLLIEPEDFT